MAGANCPLRLCDQGVTGRGPHPSFRARIMMREAQTATRRFGTISSQGERGSPCTSGRWCSARQGPNPSHDHSLFWSGRSGLIQNDHSTHHQSPITNNHQLFGLVSTVFIEVISTRVFSSFPGSFLARFCKRPTKPNKTKPH